MLGVENETNTSNFTECTPREGRGQPAQAFFPRKCLLKNDGNAFGGNGVLAITHPAIAALLQIIVDLDGDIRQSHEGTENAFRDYVVILFDWTFAPSLILQKRAGNQ